MNFKPCWRGRAWRELCVLGLALACGLASAQRPPVEDFTKLPEIDNVAISPSGKRLALLVFGQNGRRRLGVMDLDPIGKPRVVADFNDADITKLWWVNDERLVFEAFQPGAEVRDGGAATYAVNHDGEDLRKLISWQQYVDTTASRVVSRLLTYGWFMYATVDDGSDEILVYHRVTDSRGDMREIQLARLDTRSGALRNLSHGMPDGTRQWVLDQNDRPRVVVARRDGRNKVFWRARDKQEWKEISDFDPLSEPGFNPLHVDDEGQIVVTARQGSDISSLHRFDPETQRLDPQPLVRIAGFDLAPRLEIDRKTGRLIGLHLRAAMPVSVWFDAGLQRIQDGIDAALPKGRANRLYCDRCLSARFFVVGSSSDRQPAQYFLFDRQKAALQAIGGSRPWIDEARQGRRSFQRIAARDGLQIPLYVTRPADAKEGQALPAVVLVHGGPWVRGADLRWNSEAQFLASRGYVVLEPEFRGSTGYGFNHYKAGWKQWGRAMQDDLIDAVQWAASRQLVDPKRVCIVGGSYGGYAALMGPIAQPNAYRCAASFAGVTDIGLMYSVTWSDLSEESRRYGMPVLIGDETKDAAMLASVSPLKRVAEIKVPVLLAHGGADKRVPIEHARQFSRAALDAGVTLEWVQYLEEGHGFFDPANHTDYYKRLERFLDKALEAPR
jgi:dienelactone hydrolase